jgi:hypothetical protein
MPPATGQGTLSSVGGPAAHTLARPRSWAGLLVPKAAPCSLLTKRFANFDSLVSVNRAIRRLNVPYTLHGIGTRKGIIRDRREVVLRFTHSYVEGIYLFKTNKELAERS